MYNLKVSKSINNKILYFKYIYILLYITNVSVIYIKKIIMN